MLLILASWTGSGALLAAEPGTATSEGAGIPKGFGVDRYEVGAGDLLDILVYGEDDLSDQYLVSADGRVDLPLVGEVAVDGLTTDQIADRLESRYGKDYLVNPHVTVQVERFGSKPVQVMGAVESPGMYHLTGPTNLLQMLALAGGVVSEKSIKEVHIRRQDDENGTIVVNLDRLMGKGEGNRVLQGGDVVYVPEGVVVYISGEVQKPGPVPFWDGLTLTQALTAAGGPTTTARLKEVYLLRDGDRRPVNLKKVMQGRSEDVALEPGDQIFLEEAIF